MIIIDGSQGEGGGQILRTALALSMVTGKPFRLEKVRAGREKPGLMRQHLTALRAAAEICAAQVTGDELALQRTLSFTNVTQTPLRTSVSTSFLQPVFGGSPLESASTL